MSTFQDFGPLSERRKAELEQKRRRRIMIAGGALCIIVIIAAVSAVAVLYINKNSHTAKNTKSTHSGSSSDSDHSGSGSSAISAGSKLIQTICSSTDYKEACLSTLKKMSNSTTKPKEIIKASVSAIYKEVDIAFLKAKEHKTNDPLTVGAIEVCERLLNDSKSDLMETMDKIDASKLDDLQKVGPVLNVWLSAVRSYQETCVDSFPEGEGRDKMKEAMKKVNELTSNGLAIVKKAGNLMSELSVAGSTSRRLLVAEEENGLDGDGFPGWVDEGGRRVLLQNAAAGLKPNVVVAKDGSGQFTTIMAAINAMPKKYDGRYVQKNNHDLWNKLYKLMLKTQPNIVSILTMIIDNMFEFVNNMSGEKIQIAENS